MNFFLVCISLSSIFSAYAENFTYTNVHETYFRSDNELSNSDRGPCPPGHYVHLLTNETVVECVAHNCLMDGFVPYNGTCQRIGVWGVGPCNVGGLVIDPETFQPKCIDEVVRPLSVASQLSCFGNSYLNTFYSEDVGSWKCECYQTRHVYFPLGNECHEPYRQGPCEVGSYLYPPIGKTEAQCVVNPCIEDGLVPYKGSCYKLAIWDEGPCEFGGLVVDPITLQLKCLNEIELSIIPWSPEVLIRCSEPTYLKKFRSNPKYWRCRCHERNKLYLPSHVSCYDAYKQGPCESGEYVQLAINETVAKCARNPCQEDDMGLYNGSCYKIGLWGEGPCNIGGLVIDQETFQLKCIDEITDSYSSRNDLKCSGDRILFNDHSVNPRDWKCECEQPGFVYFPLNNKCYELYRQGPCPSGHYVYLAINETVPQCVVNLCFRDGLVFYNGSCYEYAVWGKGPCIIGGLVADPRTSQLKCVEEIPNSTSVAKRMKCPHDLMLHGTGSSSLKEWKCECSKDNHLYFPTYNDCVEVYRQGPCPPGHYVYRAINETVPQCVVNPCHNDGDVPYNGACHTLELEGEGICSSERHLKINKWTFQLECQDISLVYCLLAEIPEFHCPPGTQEDQNGLCRPTIP